MPKSIMVFAIGFCLYDDSWDTVLTVFRTREDAERHVEKHNMRARFDEIQIITREISEENAYLIDSLNQYLRSTL